MFPKKTVDSPNYRKTAQPAPHWLEQDLRTLNKKLASPSASAHVAKAGLARDPQACLRPASAENKGCSRGSPCRCSCLGRALRIDGLLWAAEAEFPYSHQWRAATIQDGLSSQIDTNRLPEARGHW
ncbi:uncharacterized protein VTP21DRAFT_7317 [Calcarisporiella thermophila]|uniref:uncharacterized protein n=1 Tax=Calcarisporiella thermophila TaxID=911321 RepID=UPI003744ACC7